MELQRLTYEVSRGRIQKYLMINKKQDAQTMGKEQAF
jgi:hypothetical protein